MTADKRRMVSSLLFAYNLKQGLNPAEKGGRPKDVFEMAFSRSGFKTSDQVQGQGADRSRKRSIQYSM